MEDIKVKILSQKDQNTYIVIPIYPRDVIKSYPLNVDNIDKIPNTEKPNVIIPSSNFNVVDSTKSSYKKEEIYGLPTRDDAISESNYKFNLKKKIINLN
jgi:hypothetical protein